MLLVGTVLDESVLPAKTITERKQEHLTSVARCFRQCATLGFKCITFGKNKHRKTRKSHKMSTNVRKNNSDSGTVDMWNIKRELFG